MLRTVFLLLCFSSLLKANSLSDALYWRSGSDDAWAPMSGRALPPGWTGEGWFSTKYHAPDDVGDARVLLVGIYGEIEAFFDNEPMDRLAGISAVLLEDELGKEDAFTVPHQIFRLPSVRPGSEHAIHIYLRGNPNDVRVYGMTPHFHIDIRDGTNLLRDQARLVRVTSRHEMFLLGFCLSFAIIHLLLYIYYKELKTNLYYAGFTGSAALLGLVFVGVLIRVDQTNWFTTMAVSTLVLALNQAMAVRLAYSMILPKPPHFFRYILAYYAALSVWGMYQPFLVFEIQGSVILIALAEIARVVLIHRLSGRAPLVRGSRLLVYGGALSAGALLYQLADFNFALVKAPFTYAEFPMILYAPLPLMLGMSILLSRFFARTNHELKQRLSEVEQLSRENLEQARARALLEAENERKNLELEEARRLQLSMLPNRLPIRRDLEIGAFMKTATEVGGDYYDFHHNGDGALVAVIGDATGHGLRASNMVVAAKSLVGAYVDLFEPAPMLTLISKGIRRMQFKGMFMAMSAVVIREDQLHLAVAGMPAALHFHHATQSVEAIEMRSLPLGAPLDYSYRNHCFTMAPGDVLLLQSDGLPERFNGARQLYGMDRIEKVLCANAQLPPQALIEQLVADGEVFAQGAPQNDDMTFLVLKKPLPAARG